jgi:hypothetical protein
MLSKMHVKSFVVFTLTVIFPSLCPPACAAVSSPSLCQLASATTSPSDPGRGLVRDGVADGRRQDAVQRGGAGPGANQFIGGEEGQCVRDAFFSRYLLPLRSSTWRIMSRAARDGA